MPTRSNYNSRCSLQVGCLRPWQRCSAPASRNVLKLNSNCIRVWLAQSPEAMSLQLSAVSPQLANLWETRDHSLAFTYLLISTITHEQPVEHLHLWARWRSGRPSSPQAPRNAQALGIDIETNNSKSGFGSLWIKILPRFPRSSERNSWSLTLSVRQWQSDSLSSLSSSHIPFSCISTGLHTVP